MHQKEILSLMLKKNNGYLKTSEAQSAGVSRTVLCDYVRKNNLEKVARGLYMSNDTWMDFFYVIQYRYPNAIFSHETALFLHEIANREPDPISVTVRAGTSSTNLIHDGIKVYKVKNETFDHGTTYVYTPYGNIVKTYDVERSICDLFRSRRYIEYQELQESVKTYVSSRDKNIPLLLRYAKELSVEKKVQHYLEVLL